MKIRNKSSKLSVFSIIVGIILVLYCVSLFWPMIWGLMTSFKGPLEYITNRFGLPEKLRYENYLTVLNYFYMRVENKSAVADSPFRNVYLLEMTFNSIVYAVGTAIVSFLMCIHMSYISARYKYKFSSVIYSIVVIAMVLPIVGSIPSELRVARALGLYDTLFSVPTMKAYFLGMFFLVFYSAFQSLPNDYSEAAKLDGANNFTIMYKVMFPLVRNISLTVILLNFIGYWNDYQTPMLYMPNHPTLAYGLYNFAHESYLPEISKVPMQLAACFMMAVPTLILFLLCNKRLLNNVSIGGIKG